MKNQRFIRSFAYLLFSSLFLSLQSPSFANPPKSIDDRPMLSMRQIADKCLPSVVSITVRGVDGQITKTGSGFVVGEDLIATNIHVVQNAHEVTVNFSNGRSVESLGTVDQDASSDLVLIFANTGAVKFLPFAAELPHIGDSVVALGSPDGLTGSMSTGIVSGLRMLPGVKVLQTTAPISHGSSGGPLLNDAGQVVGVTSFMLQDGQNLNFAYPAYFLKVLMLTKPDNYTLWDGSTEVWKIELERTRGLILALSALDYLPKAKSSQGANQFDAAALIKAIYNSLNIYLPKDAEAQARIGYNVPRGDLSCWIAGDRVYFAFDHPTIDHTGVYIGDGRFIHLSSNNHHVKIDNMYDAYFAAHLVCVRRSRELLYDTLPVAK